MTENYVSKEEYDKLKSENDYLKSKILELEARLFRYENPHTPPSMRINRYPKREPSGNPVGKPEGSHGATRKLEHRKPDEIIPIKPRKCRSCNTHLGEPISWKKQLVEDIPTPQPSRLIEFQKGICICPGCGVENVGTDPRCPTVGEFGPLIMSQVNDLRYRQRFSVGMTKRHLRERYGITISNASILNISSRTAKLLRFTENKLIMKIRNSSVVYVDETGFYVNGIREWCWIFITNRDVLIVIRESRGSRIPKAILGNNFRGAIVSDCYSAYELLKKQLPNADFQKCWAHMLREAEYCAKETEEGKLLHSELISCYGRMKDFLKSDHPPDIREFEYATCLEYLDNLTTNIPKEPRCARLFKRLRRYREDWFTCIRISGVEPTNNRAERGLRPQVILRRLRGSLRSERGREDHETMTSIMASWELQGLNPALQLEHELSQIFVEGGVM
ncbi:IS66 family transposase [archaeon]|nr:IS66 family transposase [archaeon]